MADPTVQVYSLVSGSLQNLALSAAVELVRASPDGYVIRPPGAVNGGAFIASALLNLFQDAHGDPTATSNDLLNAILAGSGGVGGGSGFDTPFGNGAAGNGIADDRAAIAATDTAVGGSAGTMVLENGKVYRVASDLTINANVDFMGGTFSPDTGVEIFLTNDVLHLSDYLKTYPNDYAKAVTQALIRLFTSTNYNSLDGDGLSVSVLKPIVLNAANIPAFGASKIIRNFRLNANPAGTWAAGNSLFNIENTGGLTPINHIRFYDMHFDAGGITGVRPFRLFNYYHAYFSNCIFENFTEVGSLFDLNDSVGTPVDPGTGKYDRSHGLMMRDCRWKPDSSGSTTGSTCLRSYDSDCIIIDGHVDWPKVGFEFFNSSVHVRGVHFSMELNASEPNGRLAIICRDPTNIHLSDLDLDGGYILLTNVGFEATLGQNTGWKNISLNNLDFVASFAPAAGYGFITLETNVAATALKSLIWTPGNTAYNQGSSIKAILTKLVGAGTFDPADSTIYLGHLDTNGVSFNGTTGFLKIISGGQDTHIRYDDAGNAIIMRLNGVDRFTFTNGGNLTPINDNAKDIGASTTRFANGFFGTLVYTGATPGLTAFAGGGQASALQLTTQLSRIGVVATAADSVKLPTGVAGMIVYVINGGANAMQVFLNAAGTINGINGVTTGVSQAAGTVGKYFFTTSALAYRTVETLA